MTMMTKAANRAMEDERRSRPHPDAGSGRGSRTGSSGLARRTAVFDLGSSCGIGNRLMRRRWLESSMGMQCNAMRRDAIYAVRSATHGLEGCMSVYIYIYILW